MGSHSHAQFRSRVMTSPRLDSSPLRNEGTSHALDPLDAFIETLTDAAVQVGSNGKPLSSEWAVQRMPGTTDAIRIRNRRVEAARRLLEARRAEPEAPAPPPLAAMLMSALGVPAADSEDAGNNGDDTDGGGDDARYSGRVLSDDEGDERAIPTAVGRGACVLDADKFTRAAVAAHAHVIAGSGGHAIDGDTELDASAEAEAAAVEAYFADETIL